MSKRTPGEYRVESNNRGGWNIGDGLNHTIAHVYANHENAHRTAVQFAVAPRMEEALRNMVAAARILSRECVGRYVAAVSSAAADARAVLAEIDKEGG